MLRWLSSVRRLLLCEEIERSSCGSVLFHGYLPPPGTVFPQLLLPGILSSGTGELQDVIVFSLHLSYPSISLSAYKEKVSALVTFFPASVLVFELLVFLTFIKCVRHVEF